MGRFFGGGWMMILWFGVLLLVVYAIIRWTNSTKQNRIVSSDALSILAERYAKGEITTEEFNVIKKELK
ncbi:SHOCT domain-containing protein [bacterium]|nr:SHOCT domain-containing protein [bacterium]